MQNRNNKGPDFWWLPKVPQIIWEQVNPITFYTAAKI